MIPLQPRPNHDGRNRRQREPAIRSGRAICWTCSLDQGRYGAELLALRVLLVLLVAPTSAAEVGLKA